MKYCWKSIQPMAWHILLLLLLLSRFIRVRLCATPQTAAHQAPPSLGFSRQERWSGLPFPSPMHESEKQKGSRSVVSDSYRPHRLQPSRLLRPWEFPGTYQVFNKQSMLPQGFRNFIATVVITASCQYCHIVVILHNNLTYNVSFLKRLFILGCAGSSLLYASFLQLQRVGVTLQLSCVGFSSRWLFSLQGTGSRHSGFSSCGIQAQQWWCTGLVAPQHVESS